MRRWQSRHDRDATNSAERHARWARPSADSSVTGFMRAAGVLQRSASPTGRGCQASGPGLDQRSSASQPASLALLRNNFDAVEETLTAAGVMVTFAQPGARRHYGQQVRGRQRRRPRRRGARGWSRPGRRATACGSAARCWCCCTDLPNELGRIRDMAERIGTVGGHMALKDTLALSALLAGVSMRAPDALSAGSPGGGSGQGSKPEQTTAVGSAALQTIRSRTLDVNGLQASGARRQQRAGRAQQRR